MEREKIKAWLSFVIATTGWSAREWADKAGTSPSNITRFLADDDSSMMKQVTLDKLAAAVPTLPPPSADLPIPASHSTNNSEMPPKRLSEVKPTLLPSPGYMPKDVPIYGVVAAHDSDGEFNIIREIIDYGRRPPALSAVKDVYGLYIATDSMEPAYRQGSLVYVRASQPPRIGDDIIIQLHPRKPGDEPPAFIKRLVRRTAERLIVQQFNPPREIDFPLKDVIAMHRVIPWEEILGM